MNLVERFPDTKAAAQACAREIVRLLSAAIAEREIATIAISGGTSPKPMFEELSRAKLDWDFVHVFWVDERVVSPGDPASNFKLANETWLAPAKIPVENV
ncbi:MAG: 6-phosphogluconolactonase, partial [Acidobacteriota bacterium]